VLNLVTSYKILELQNSVREYLASFPLTEETVLDVAQDSMKYSETFAEDVNELQMCCARYLRHKLQDASSLIKFNFDNKDRKDVVHRLFILMNDVKMSKCTNCLQLPCRDGQIVERTEFRLGLMVVGGQRRGVEGKVIGLKGGGGRYMSCSVTVENDNDSEKDFPLINNNGLWIRYWCEKDSKKRKL